MKHYFLTRKKELVECELISESPYKREIKILEGEQKGQKEKCSP